MRSLKLISFFEKNKKRIFFLVAVLAVLSVTIAVVGAIFVTPENVDELEHLHAAWLWTKGYQPYTDFYEHHQRFYWLFLRPVVTFFEYDIFSAIIVGRLAMLTSAYLFIAVSFFLYARLLGRGPAWFATALWLLFMVVEIDSFIIRPDMLMMFFLAAGTLLLFRSSETVSSSFKRHSQAVLSGIFYGLAFLVTPKAVFWIAPVLGSLFIIFIFQYRKKLIYYLLPVIISGLVTCLVVGLDSLYLSLVSDWDKYYNAVFVANQQGVKVWKSWIEIRRAHGVIVSWKYAPAIVVLAGFCVSLSKFAQENYRVRCNYIILWSLLLGALALVFMANIGFIYNFFILLWVNIGLASLAFDKIFFKLSGFSHAAIILFFFILVFDFGLPVNRVDFSLTDSLRPLQFILREAEPDDTYLFTYIRLGHDFSSIYNPVFVLDSDRQYFMSFMNPEYEKGTVPDLIRKTKPRFVCVSYLKEEDIIKYDILLRADYQEIPLFAKNNKFVEDNEFIDRSWWPKKKLYLRLE